MLPDLDGDLEATLDTMPSYVGHSAQCCVKDLLQTDPRSRLGSGPGGAQDVKVTFITSSSYYYSCLMYSCSLYAC
jgi:hypothetical protein